MQDLPEPERKGLFERASTRRALLAGAATIAAGGTAAAVVGLANGGKTGSNDSNAASGAQSNTPAATAGPDPNRPIEDPKVRAAHLLRRAAWGGTAAQIAEFAGLGREE